MQKAVNPQTGEVLFLVDNQWVPPAQTAVNPQGQKAFLVGNEWITDQGAAQPSSSQPASVAPQQPEQPAADESKTSNPFHGMFGRAASILGEGAEALQRSTAGLRKAQSEGLGSLASPYLSDEAVVKRQQEFTNEARKYAKDTGYTPSTTLAELGDNPLKVVPFVAERVITSAPDMAAAAAAFWPYVMSRTNEILNERLKNDNKTYEQATVADVAAATAGAVAEASLEKFATKRLIPGGGAVTKAPQVGTKAALGRVGKEVGLQSSTEAGEELASYMGESVGTEKGFDPQEAGLRMLEAGIVGGGLGAGVRGGREVYDAGKKAKEDREEEKRKQVVADLYAEEKAKAEKTAAEVPTEVAPTPLEVPATGRTIERMEAPAASTDLQSVLDEIMGTPQPTAVSEAVTAETVAPLKKEKLEKPQEVTGKIEDFEEVDVPVKDLKLSKDVPQFKSEADIKGIVEPLKGKKYETVGTPPIQVWRRNDGTMEVISGRHRLDLARRTGTPNIKAQVFDESKGFNADQAAIMDAELNIREGTGKVKDYVNYFNQTGKRFGLSKEDYESRGLLDRATGKRAYAVAVQGVDDLIQALNAGKVSEDQAYRIASVAPNDSRLQSLGLKLVNEKPTDQAINILQATKTIPTKTQEQGGDLFGFDDSAMKEAEQMGKLALDKQRAINADISTIERAGKQPAIAKKYGIDVRDPEAILAKVKQMKDQRAAWDNWASDPKLVDQIRRELAGEPVAEAVPAEAKPEKAKAEKRAAKKKPVEKTVAVEDAVDEAKNAGVSTEEVNKIIGKKQGEDAQNAVLDDLEEKSEAGGFDLFNLDFNKINGDRNSTWRKEKIAEYKSARQRMSAITTRLAKGKFGELDESNYKWLYEYSKKLKDDIDITKPKRDTAADVLAKAAKELADGNIDQEVFDVFDYLYKKFPHLIDGLRLQVRAAPERNAAGSFLPAARIVRLYKDTSGTYDPSTARHEVVHSMEQMMDRDQAKTLVNEWYKAVTKAMKAEKTPQGKEFFKAMEEFLKRPTQVTMDMAINAMPNSSYYQYINPSEYWAVNAEPLLKAQLGGAWLKFKQKLRALWDAIKHVFGASNFHVGNKVFDQILNGERLTEMMLSDYIGRINSYDSFSYLKNYKGAKPPLASWGSPDISMLDNFLYRIVDKHIDTKRVLQAITETVDELKDALNVYRRETLYHGRVTARTEDFLKDELRPLVKEMVDGGISLDQFDEFMHNRHAEERNIQNNKVNTESDDELAIRIEAEEMDLADWEQEMKEMRAEFGDDVAPHRPKPVVDYKKQVLRLKDEGSGIKTEDARAYMENLKKNDPETYKKLKSLAAKADAIVKGTQKVLVDGGVETAETVKKWTDTYKHYVPLFREDLDFVQTNLGTGQGQSARGGATRRAVGSTKEVSDIFANLVGQRERAIVRAEKAHVGRSLLALAIMNPNPSFWLPINPDAIKSKKDLKEELMNLGVPVEDAENIMAQPQTLTVDPKTGLAHFKTDKYLLNSDNVFAVRVNGKDRFIIFNFSDPRAKRMCEALKNLDADQLGVALSIFSKVTRFVAQMNTQYNPVFGIWNFMRDYGGAMLNLSTTDLAGEEGTVGSPSNVFGAWRGIYKELRSDDTAGDGEWAKLWEDFRKAGGQTGYRQQFLRPEENANVVKDEISKITAGRGKNALNKTMKLFSDFNESMENAVRLSAYKAALEKYAKEGVDPDVAKERAAELAKNLTVNFNRKGQWSTIAGSLYAFFNASVQGTARVAETLTGPKGMAIIKGGLFVGVVQAAMLSLAGFGDDEPPEFIKERNFVIPIFGTKKYISIPLPLGFNIIPNAGRLITEMTLNATMGNGSRVVDKSISLLTSLLDGFNPMGSGSIIQQATPTLFDPLSALYANKDSFGRPIFREDRATAPTPGFLRSRESATEISKGISWFLNYITSPIGTKYTKGFISPTADEIDYVVGQYLGGAGRETMKIANLVRDVAKGEETAPYKIPVVGRIYGDAESKASISSHFYDNVTKLAKMEEEIKQRRQHKENAYEFMRKNPETRLIDTANRLENEISALNKERKELLARDKTEQAKKIDERKKKLMENFNKQYDKIISK